MRLIFIVFAFIIFACPSLLLGQSVSGTVFRDLDYSGAQDVVELGVPSITVRAYDSSGEISGSPVTTDNTGSYSITGGTGDLRVEFELPSWYFASNGDASNTSIQFVASGGTANLGINNMNDYFATNPDVIFPCYVNGNTTGGGNAATMDVLVEIPYDIGCGEATAWGGSLPNPTHLSFGNDIGSVWGIAYQRETQSIFSATFLKRHMGMGPGSDGNGAHASGAIYRTDVSGAVPVNSFFFSLDQLGFPSSATGTYSGDNSVDNSAIINTDFIIGSNTDRQLPDDSGDNNTDPTAYHQIGRVALGDLDISDEGRHLYVVNLYDKKLYKIFIDNPATAPTAGDITSYTIPDPGCTDGEFMPWAVSFHHGKVYVGGVCNAEDDPVADGSGTDAGAMATRAKMISYVYEFTDATNSFNTSPVFTMPMDYLKGGAEGGSVPSTSDDINNYWGNWKDDQIKDREYSEPILGDIEFDQDGSMILGFIDRVGHQKGYRNADPDDGIGSPGTGERKYSAGDILRAYPNGVGGWIAESGGDKDGAGPYTASAGQMNNEGPGGGEFYFRDTYYSGCSPSDQHAEISMGGVAVWLYNQEVVNTVFDPTDLFSGGVTAYSNEDGEGSTTFRYAAFVNSDGSPPFFGKAAGIGDVELQSEPAILEIGNLVFEDEGSGTGAFDANGQQDPGEPGINAVTVTFECTVGAMTYTTTTTTDANGNYFFRDNDANIIAGNFPQAPWDNSIRIIPRDASCMVSLGASQTGSGGSIDFVPNPGGVGDLIDSDGSDNAGTVEHTFNSGFSGQNNHSYDFGFSASAASACSLTNAGETLETCNDNGTGTNDADDYITFSLNPTGSDLGASYSVSVDNGGTVSLAGGGAATGISYGSATAFRLQDGSADGATTYTITITDASGTPCVITTSLQQSACSGSCPPIQCLPIQIIKNN